MIKLFSTPRSVIDLSNYDNLLHGSPVRQFEERVADYVGARYACSFNSASSAIFLIMRMMVENWPHLAKEEIEIPATIPPVVPNMILNAGIPIRLIDNYEWIGGSYLLANFLSFGVIDSAQAISKRVFGDAEPDDLMIFSFYPTKPVGGIDGGMVVSNDRDKIEHLRTMSMNGASSSTDSWERTPQILGWKMYMNSVQAQVANESLTLLDDKITKLDRTRRQFDRAFDQASIRHPAIPRSTAGGHHLYRIYVANNHHFVQQAQEAEIICGIHYHSLHRHPLYGRYATNSNGYGPSSYEHRHTASIPFHAGLTDIETQKVIDFTIGYQERHGPPPTRDDWYT